MHKHNDCKKLRTGEQGGELALFCGGVADDDWSYSGEQESGLEPPCNYA
jgi:hypothetical protein